MWDSGLRYTRPWRRPASNPAAIGFVNAHGTGTHDNDLVEGKVLAEIFGPELKMLSTKGLTGHTLGAAGGIEAVFTAAGLRAGWVPASAGFVNKDEEIPIAPVRETTTIKGSYAASTSLAFGGTNAAIVIGREASGMKIAGIGLLCSQGMGMANFEKSLRSGWQRPGETAAHWLGGKKAMAYLVDLAAVPDRTLLKKIRRSDAVSKMSVLAAADALQDSGIENINQKKIGIILATAFGPHVTTFNFLDDILDHGDPAVSPTTFSNSVHNAAASYISTAFNIKGPTLTISQFRFSFQSALQLAKSWLDQGPLVSKLPGWILSPVLTIPGKASVSRRYPRERTAVECSVQVLRGWHQMGANSRTSHYQNQEPISMFSYQLPTVGGFSP